MEFINVYSSWIDSYAYDSGDLYIRFKDGALCHYEDVPLSLWEGLLSATSKGHYVYVAFYYWPYNLL